MESLNLFESLLCISPFVLYYALEVNVIHKHRILIPCHKYHMHSYLKPLDNQHRDLHMVRYRIR